MIVPVKCFWKDSEIKSNPLTCCSVNDYVVEGEAQLKNYGEMYKNFKGLVDYVNSAILDKLVGANPSGSGHQGIRDVNASSSER